MLHNTGVKFLLGLAAGIAAVVVISVVQRGTPLTGQTVSGCEYCMTSIGNCVYEPSNVGQCSGAERWSSYLSCSSGDPPNPSCGGTPPPTYSGWYFNTCQDSCIYMSNSSWPLAYASQVDCDNARVNQCGMNGCIPSGCACGPDGIMHCDNPGSTTSCDGDTCNPCDTAYGGTLPQCTIGSQSLTTISSFTQQSMGGACGYVDQYAMGACCIGSTVFPSTTPITCSNPYECLSAGAPVLDFPPATGSCTTFCMSSATPSCELAGGGGNYTGGDIAPGGICELSNSGGCCLNPSDDEPFTAGTSNTLPCQDPANYECRASTDGYKRCQSRTSPICNSLPTCMITTSGVQPGGTWTGQPILSGNVCELTTGSSPCCFSFNDTVSHTQAEVMCATAGETCSLSSTGLLRCIALSSSASSFSSSRSSISSSRSSLSSSAAPSVCCFSNLPPDADICRPIPPPAPF